MNELSETVTALQRAIVSICMANAGVLVCLWMIFRQILQINKSVQAMQQTLQTMDKETAEGSTSTLEDDQ